MPCAPASPARVRHNVHVALRAVREFRPDVAVTDFSGFAYYARLVSGCPIVSVDHQHVIDRFNHPREVTADFHASFKLARATVTAKTPGCDRFVVTSFYFPEPRSGTEASTRLAGPLLRPELDVLTPTRGEHVLVYQTASGDTELLTALQSHKNVPFRWHTRAELRMLRLFLSGRMSHEVARHTSEAPGEAHA